MKRRILLLHGPNLNLTGKREPEVYGTKTLDEINGEVTEAGLRLGFEVRSLQSNHEGDLIDALHQAWDTVDGAVINPGALAHYSYALRDAVAAVPYPVIEVHMSNIAAREQFRHESVLTPVCAAQITGMGWHAYLSALEALVGVIAAVPSE